MSLLKQSLLAVRTPVIQAKRFRGKINLKNPKICFDRAKYLALAKPWFLSVNKDKTLVELCDKDVKINKEECENPYEKIIAKEALRHFQTSRLIAFYHANPISSYENFKAFALFKKEGMLLKNYGKKTLQIALEDTPYKAVLDFYMSRNMMVFSPEPKLKTLLKLNKKFPQYILIAGIYEGKFMNVDDLLKYSLIPNLQTAQSQFLQTLNASSNKLNRQLNSHQTRLLSLLEDRKKQLDN